MLKFKQKKAIKLIENARIEEALEYCRSFLNSAKLIEKVSNDYSFFETLAEIHYLKKLYPEAIDYAKQTLQMNANSLISLAVLFNIYDKAKKFDEAIAILEQSVELDDFPTPNQPNKDFNLEAVKSFNIPINSDFDWEYVKSFAYDTFRPLDLFTFFIETNLELTLLAKSEYKDKGCEILKKKL